jgi:hypothetical protein
VNSVEFGKILERQINRTIDILGSKAEEYANDDERLHNFKVIAELQGITLHQAVVNLMAKHTVSIFDLARSEGEVSEELWNEKITDHINYLILLQAALAEERKGPIDGDILGPDPRGIEDARRVVVT